MVRRPNPDPVNMTQTYSSSSQADERRPDGYSSAASDQTYSQASTSPEQFGDRGLSDAYYGRQEQQQQPPPYGQPGHSQPLYNQGLYGQAYPQQYGQSANSPYDTCGPPYHASSGHGSPQAGLAQPSAPSQYSNETYPHQAPPLHAGAAAPEPYGSAPYNPSAPVPGAAVEPPGPSFHPGDPEQRGIMGALAGGAAGGYAGHRLHHGFLGALGGAYAGHKLEETYKEHHQKPQQQAPPSQPSSPQPQQMRGNFSASSRKISLDRDHDLIAEVAPIRGPHRLSSISLNSCLTNDNGHFRWQRDGGFGASARDVHLTPDGKELRAELRTREGKWQRSSIRLDERITNNDGNLQVVW